ncbi:2-keto-4-pentenoate hydratase [Agrobacterium tumefaciens]|uniref:2-keto-4-pentenoate hydratase n=1 Tax=Agrobacterium tumefaciens TaxID=358 RepID=UPI00287C6E45|nr:2-keto-4-pentenoate hydratase [Agrobacterium tumefaciens]MDS7594774.1 2-keto-4-pentenoate hydratase [Agrobacterium tumefaciens]
MAMIEELARKFANAVADEEKIPLATLEHNGLVPKSLEEAMAVQRAFVETSGKALAGWKLAIISDGRAVAAPMIDCYQIDANSIASFPGQGISALEVEICFTLAADIPAATATPFSRTDILRHIDKVHLGVELLAYRLAEKNQVPFPLFLADRLANHSFVLGPEIDPAIVDIFAQGNDALTHLTVTEGTTTLFDSTVKHPAIDPLAPLVAFANASLNTGGLLKRGQIMTTGSLCGAVPSSLDADTLVTLSPAGTLTLKPQK